MEWNYNKVKCNICWSLGDCLKVWNNKCWSWITLNTPLSVANDIYRKILWIINKIQSRMTLRLQNMIQCWFTDFTRQTKWLPLSFCCVTVCRRERKQTNTKFWEGTTSQVLASTHIYSDSSVLTSVIYAASLPWISWHKLNSSWQLYLSKCQRIITLGRTLLGRMHRRLLGLLLKCENEQRKQSEGVIDWD